MMRRRLLIAIAILALYRLAFAQPPMESSLGTCAAFVLSSGDVKAADHELDEGYFSIGGTSLMAPPQSAAFMRLSSERGKDVELVIRPVKCRAVEGISR